MQAKLSAAFTLTGSELDPDEVTMLVGVTPTKTWRVGDLIDGRATLRYKHNGWQLKANLGASLQQDTQLEEHVTSVLEHLRPGWLALTELGAKYDAEIACAVYMHPNGQVPAIHFAKDTISRAGELHAEIDIDLYVIRKHEGQEG